MKRTVHNPDRTFNVQPFDRVSSDQLSDNRRTFPARRANLTPTSASFGTISGGPANLPRNTQLALRIIW
jgi:hypothetical protein